MQKVQMALVRHSEGSLSLATSRPALPTGDDHNMTLWLLCRAPDYKCNHWALLFMVLSKTQTLTVPLRTNSGDWSIRIKATIFMQGLLRQSSVTYLMCQTGVSHYWNPREDIHGPEGRQQDLLHKPHDPTCPKASSSELPPQIQINPKPHNAQSICDQLCPAQFSCFVTIT